MNHVSDEHVAAAVSAVPTATRKDLQIGRRLVHMTNGFVIATAYALLFTHEQIIHLFGVIACLVYILDRVRIHYPELMQQAPRANTLFFRAEEQLKESAMTPYAIAILLTLITFPKPIAIIGIAGRFAGADSKPDGPGVSSSFLRKPRDSEEIIREKGR